MINYYEVMEVAENATEDEIKRAYRRLALLKHPDKQGGSEEAFKLLNKANQVLMDGVSRRKYDEARKLFRLTEEEEVYIPRPGVNPKWTPAGYLKTKSRAFSDTFRHQHASFVAEFNSRETTVGGLKSCFDAGKAKPFSDFLTGFRNKNNSTVALDKFENEPLTTTWAIHLLNNFLSGQYTSADAQIILRQLTKKLERLRNTEVIKKDKLLYDGIIEILNSCLQAGPVNDALLKAMQKISDHAKALAERSDDSSLQILRQLTPLFANKRYRNMYAFALHQYWISDLNGMGISDLQVFNGLELVKKALDKHKEDYIREEKEEVLALVKLFVLLNKLEKHNNNHPKEYTKDKCQFYRDKGYLMLDWIPAISGLVDPQLIYNTLLQAGICFQLAAQLEIHPAWRRADEKLAFNIYMNAWSLANKSTPDVELYINTAILKFIAQFQNYKDDKLKQIISHIAHRALVIADVYPFYIPCQSNMVFVQDEGKSITLLRQYLHLLVNAREVESKSDKIFDHDYVTVLYEVYDACLKNWYEKQLSSAVENSFRHKLMEELLRINRWTFADIHRLVVPTSVTVTRNPEAWIQPTRSLTFSSIQGVEFLSSVDGFEINFANGQLMMICKRTQPEDSGHKKLFTYDDVQEIFNKRVTSAIFSLDQVDPDMPHHPFNKVRFQPSHLHQSQLLHCMLLADYLLKFLTVGKEVQGNNPFAMRELQELIRPLPAHLKRIIQNFQAASSKGAIHRFWIEAEELPVATKNEEQSDTLRMAFNQLRMIVKKHVMKRDTNGELVDEEREDEGWDIFVGNPDLRHHDKPAMVWNESTRQVVFYMDGQRSEPVVIDEPQHLIRKMFKLSRDAQGKVTGNNSEDEYLLYSFTKKIADITTLPHRFSAEYCFAKEFSHYYDEFAIYFPELGRLRELSKIVMITRILCGQREANFERITKIKSELQDPAHWKQVKDQILPEARRRVSELIDKNRQLVKYDELPNTIQAQLNKLKASIGTLYYTTSSPEIRELANKNYENAKQDIIGRYGYAAWNQHSSDIWNKIQNKMEEVARNSSSEKFNNCLSQLRAMYSDELAAYDYGTVTSILTDFLNGRMDRLQDAIVASIKTNIVEQLTTKVFPSETKETVRAALNRQQYAINNIAESVAQNNINEIKKSLSETLVKFERLEKSFAQMGLSATPSDINLDRVCLWVPASINHEVEDRRARTVYGGVQINGRVCQLNGNQALNNSAMSTVQNGTKVYRVWGGEALPYGRSWTTVNPFTAPNFRDGAGLPNVNHGTGIVWGNVVNTSTRSTTFPAAPCDGNKGGLPETYIAEAHKHVRLTFASYGKTPLF